MKPICVTCQRFYRPVKNGCSFIEAMPLEHSARPGNEEPSKWTPYKLWQGDLWECQGCRSRIIVGTGFSPVAIHHEENFDEVVAAHSPVTQVNDC